MAEFRLGGVPRDSNGAPPLATMPVPIVLGALQPLLPNIENPIGEAIVDEAKAALQGHADTPAVDEKIGKQVAKKVIRGGPLGEAIRDVLFGGQQAGAPDPQGRYDVVQVDQAGNTYTMNADGQMVQVQMLPMWTADP